jgi:hypothetical protein
LGFWALVSGLAPFESKNSAISLWSKKAAKAIGVKPSGENSSMAFGVF